MYLIDVKDIREMRFYEVPLDESAIEAALEECGIVSDAPLGLKVRVKNLRPDRMVHARAEQINGSTDQFRINLYFPMNEPPPIWVADFNKAVRHQFAHLAQVRKNGGAEVEDEAAMSAYEEEARTMAEHGTCDILVWPKPE